MINIAEIIKRFPEDFEYYNILTGICTVEILENDDIEIFPGNIILNKYGQHSSFEASECILFPKKDYRDWETYLIDSGYRINIFSRLAGLDISNRMFYYEGIGDCKIELNFEKHTIEVYTSTSPDCVDILNEFGFGYTFLKLSKYEVLLAMKIVGTFKSPAIYMLIAVFPDEVGRVSKALKSNFSNFSIQVFCLSLGTR